MILLQKYSQKKHFSNHNTGLHVSRTGSLLWHDRDFVHLYGRAKELKWVKPPLIALLKRLKWETKQPLEDSG